MKESDLTIVAFEQDGVITAYARNYPNTIAQGKDEEEVRSKLISLLENYFNDELGKLKNAKYALAKITIK